MTKAVTILALTCVLVVGAVITTILCQNSLPSAGAETLLADASSMVPNRADKQDKLAVAPIVVASLDPSPGARARQLLRQAYASSDGADMEAAKAATQAAPAMPVVSSPAQASSKFEQSTSEPRHSASLRQPPRLAYASSDDADVEAGKVLKPAARVAAPVHESRKSERSKSEPPKRERASRPVHESHELLSDAKIARIKERLKLSSSQEYYWPPVAAALRAIARKARAERQAHPNGPAAPINPDSEEVQQLESAAMPLLFQLRDDQKVEVRKLARSMGLEKVAEAI